MLQSSKVERAGRSFATVAAIVWASQSPLVHAQEVETAPSGAATSEVPAESAGPESAGSGDIIVTAQRRSQRLRDVPITVTALGGADLMSAGITGSRELQNVVAGLQIQATGGYVQPNIRGIGTVQSSAGAESNVALYLDGVYMPSQVFNVFELEDIESVQVLKGPQGSLYGRNATGGAILITTRRPARDSEVRLNASYGRFDDKLVSAYVTGPLSSTISASLSGLFRDDNGYGRDVVRNVRLQDYNEKHLRGKVLFEPTNDTSILLSGDWGRVSDTGTLSLKIWNGNTNFPQLNPFIPDPLHNYALSLNPVSIAKGYGGSLEVEHDFGGVKLKSLTAARHNNYLNITDNDRLSEVDTRVEVRSNQNYQTQELVLSSDGGGAFEWLLGAFYINDRSISPSYSYTVTPTTVLEPVPPGLINRSVIHAQSISGFFEATYHLNDSLTVIAGGRYSSEKRSITQTRNPPAAGGLTFAERGATQNQFTPKFSVLYKVTPEANVYYSYNKGFKSGAFTATSFNVDITRPEKIDGHEIGLKYADRGTSLNASAFYYDYRDIQYNSRNTAGLSFLLNAAAAKIWGVDVELIVPVTPEFNVRANGAFTHSEYTSFINPPVLSPVRPNGTGGNASVNGVNVNGNQMIRTPKFTGNISGTYTRETASGTFGATASVYYNSGFPWLPEGRLFQNEYVLVNGEVSWTTAGGRYRFGLWGKNLTNAAYATSTSITANDAIAWQRPISYGVSLRAVFR